MDWEKERNELWEPSRRYWSTRLDPARRFCNRKRKSILFSLVSSLVLSLSASLNHLQFIPFIFFFSFSCIASLSVFVFSIFLAFSLPSPSPSPPRSSLTFNLILFFSILFYSLFFANAWDLTGYRCISASFTLKRREKKTSPSIIGIVENLFRSYWKLKENELKR